MILVVGATGHVGTTVIRKLTASGQKVRAFVRPTSAYQHLKDAIIELAFGDLRDETSVDDACKGIHAVIATATTVSPRGRYSFASIDGKGYQNLVRSCQRQSVCQLIFVSAGVTPFDDKIPLLHYKRLTEKCIQESGIPYTIFRGAAFMDAWLALIGSSLPLRGAENHTLRRPFWFGRIFLKAIGNLIERRGIALIPGSGERRNALIALDDVAEFLVKSIDHPKAQNAIFEIGGPQVLSWEEVLQIYRTLLNRPIRAVYSPAKIFRVQQLLLKPFSPAASNLMGLNWVASQVDSAYDTTEVAKTFGVTLTSVEEFLRQKANMPAN